MISTMRKRCLSIILTIAMVMSLFPTLTLPTQAASGTVVFNATDGMNLGQTIYDGQSSNDIDGIQLVFFNASSAENAANGITAGSFVFISKESIGGDFGAITADTSVQDPPLIMVIESNDGAAFSFQSIYVNDFTIAEQVIKFEGFLDGVSTGYDICRMNDAWEKTFNYSNGLTESKFQNVDEIRITNEDTWVYDGRFPPHGNWACFNNIQIGEPVVPNAAPVLTTSGSTASYTENGAPVVVDSDITVEDSDNETLTSATVTISGGYQSIEDVLGFLNNNNTTFGNISGSYNAGTGILSLVSAGATATLAQWKSALRAVTYSNNSQDPTTMNRTISFVVNDGTASSNTATKTVSVTPVNDPPTLTATPTNPTFIENGSAAVLFNGATVSAIESGQMISGLTMTVTNVTDTKEHLSISGTDVELTNGGSGSLSGGGSFSVIISGQTTTVTLSGMAYANEQMKTLVDGITYRNSSENPTTGGRVITLTSISDSGGTANGGSDTTSLSIASTVTVVAVNDAPTLTGGTYTCEGTNEDTTSTAVTVSAILTAMNGQDVDGDTLGIAITAIAGNGTWQYSADGSTWTSFSTVSGSASLLLSPGTSLRYVPDGINSETATITFRAWDQTSGTASTILYRNTADTTTNGGTTAFSTATATASLEVTGINDDPAITGLPASITVTENTESNVDLSAATFSDPDSGANSVTLTLAASSGTLIAADGGGVTADGSGTATLTLTGTASNIDTFLNTASNIQYTGVAGIYGANAATLTLTANDRGYGPIDTGGGADVSLGTVSINITAIAPTVTNVTSDNDNKTYHLGEPIEIQVLFSHAVDVTGTPQLTLETGAVDRTANYTGGSGSDTLTFTYITQAGDETADLDYSNTSALSLNGGTIKRDTTDAVLTLSVPGTSGSLGANKAIVIAAYPMVSLSVSPSSIAENGGTANITATLSAYSSQDVVVSLAYSGNASSGIDYTTTGTAITIPAGSLSANIVITAIDDPDPEGNETIIVSITGVTKGIENGIQQQTIAILDDDIPTIVSVSSSSSNGSYKTGDIISIQVTFSGAVTVSGTPQLSLETGTTERAIDYVSGSGSATLTFNYNVQASENNPHLDYAGTDSLTLNGGSITSGGVNASLALPTPGTAGSLGANKAIVVDTTAPTATITVSDTALMVGETSLVTITFSEVVFGFTNADLIVANGTLTGLSSSDGGITWSATFTPAAGIEDASNMITLDNTGVQDAAGNTGTGTTNSNNYAVDTKRPAVTSVAVPNNGKYKTGDTLNFFVNFSETVTVSGAPRIALEIGGVVVYAAYVSGNNTSALLFTYTIVDGNTDTNGIDVSEINLSGSTIKDAAGNDASLTLSGVGSTAGVLIDTTAPTAGGGGTIGVSDLAHNSARLTWAVASDPGTLPSNLQYKSVFSTSNNIATLSEAKINGITFGGWTANMTSSTVTGLTPNTGYYFNVLVKDEAGNEAVYTAVTASTTAAPSSGGGSSTQTQPASSAVVEVNGQKQDAGTAITQTTGGQTITTIKVDDAKLNKILQSGGDKPTVTLPTNKASDVVVGELNGQTVKNMEQKEAILEIRTGTVSYSLPAAQINIDDVSSQVGSQVALKDIKVTVKIAEPSADTVKIVENTAVKNSYQIIVKPVEFEITCTSENKTVEISKFNGYVERTVTIPDGIDPAKITTGIVLNNDGTFSHVPTNIIAINGKYYAKINSLTNSTYSVIYNPVEFTDVSEHWAKTAVNDMGSRLVVTGIGNSTYEPERCITRAEFAAIMVRALGLRQGTSESIFGDVTLTDWFNGYVDTATAYALITGYDSETFGPQDTITREQAMAIIARAIKLTGLSVDLTGSEKTALLSGYVDGATIANYAREGAAICLKAGIINGKTESSISPKHFVTRAEVAVMVQRLLQESGLI